MRLRMRYDIEAGEGKRVGVFTDLHIGVESDSKARLDEAKKCVRWAAETFRAHGVDWVVFCGDLFNSRYSINVNSLNVGIGLVRELAAGFEKVILIEGNHDTYYKNSNSVNSISFLGGLADSGGVIVVDEQPKFAKAGGRTYGFYPWGFTPDMVGGIEGFTAPDYGFGHFELNGIELIGQVSSGCRYGLQDMFALGGELFSGHYHKNGTYRDARTGRTLHMVGSCLQLDWGDCAQEKKVGILDETGYIEVPNTVNARFEKVFFSGIREGRYTSEDLERLCRGNFVKLVIDAPYQFEEILKCNSAIRGLSPLSLEPDYLISSVSAAAGQPGAEPDGHHAKTNMDYLLEYLDGVFAELKEADPSYDLGRLKELARSYYEKAMAPKGEREEQELEG